MIALITKKNWIYWLLLALAFVLLMLFYKSKMRSEKIDKQLEQGISLTFQVPGSWFQPGSFKVVKALPLSQNLKPKT